MLLLFLQVSRVCAITTARGFELTLSVAYAGSRKSPSLLSLVRAMLGKKTSPDAYMTLRERIDFAIITLIFSIFVAA